MSETDFLYVCSEIDVSNQCISWVKQAPSSIEMLALTFDQSVMISQQILAIQCILLAGLLFLKYVNSLS